MLDSYENYCEISKTIPDGVTLIAVSKTKSIEEMEGAYMAGARNFGENKVQELLEKHDKFHRDVNWHFIGHLQRNKVKYLVGKVELIQSLDRISLLKEIESQFSRYDMIANCLIEINIGEEESKSGVIIKDLEELLLEIENCKHLKVYGIMSVIPKGSKEENEKYFYKLKELYDSLKKRKFKNITMELLSMGMTHDYLTAISKGSNMVRVGEGIFGKRNYNLQ